MIRRSVFPPPGGILAVLLLLASAARGAGVEWRPFGRDAFEEARRRDLPVFLLLTAPWNRDHFVLVNDLFSDDGVVAALTTHAVPVRADVTVFPELRSLWSIPSGLVPSFHFLDAEGRAWATFPPLAKEELLFFLEETGDRMREAEPPDREPAGNEETVWEVPRDDLADRIARLLLGRPGPGHEDLVPLHADVDPSLVTFVLEYGVAYPRRAGMLRAADRKLDRLLRGRLLDRMDGGFHRSFADRERGIVHLEKVLRPNAELGGALAMRFRTSREARYGTAAAAVIRCLNDRLRTRGTTLYAGSLSADVYSAAGDQLVMNGAEYYGLPAQDRLSTAFPRPSDDVPVGANFVLHQALLQYVRAFHDEQMVRAIRRGGGLLLADGFEDDGAARRSLGVPGTGNLRDQGDAGSGLLVLHAVTGDPGPLRAAERVGEVLLERFRDGKSKVLRNVARDADLPDLVREASPAAGWNGTALRFLLELASATGEKRWRRSAEEILDAWASRIPVDPTGVGELGRAALRAERPLPVVLIVADPATPEGEALRDLALRLFDPLLLVRWIDPSRPRDARRFGVKPEGAPALWLVWDEVSGPIRDGEALEKAFQRGRLRVRR